MSRSLKAGPATLPVAPRRQRPWHAVVAISGGLDSTVLAYWLASTEAHLTLLSFDYGQRHRVELDHAVTIAGALDCPHEIVDLRSVGRLLSGSALADMRVPVPDGHYSDESMRATVVPNRNAIMLDIAVAVAISREADAVAFGAHSGDHAIYADCRLEFVEQFARLAHIANEGLVVAEFEVLAPFLPLTKTDVVRLGAALGVPFERTWSCYRGEAVHCGSCGTCTERREAFEQAGIVDPTTYGTGVTT